MFIHWVCAIGPCSYFRALMTRCYWILQLKISFLSYVQLVYHIANFFEVCGGARSLS
jgi:hypothetical protein